MSFACVSCVPLLVGGALGYVAHDRGVGVAKPLGSERSEYVDPPTSEEMEQYENGYGDYDDPVY